eukprot:scaffold9130_cov124-Isochrysis_galbana.AAC.8
MSQAGRRARSQQAALADALGWRGILRFHTFFFRYSEGGQASGSSSMLDSSQSSGGGAAASGRGCVHCVSMS